MSTDLDSIATGRAPLRIVYVIDAVHSPHAGTEHQLIELMRRLRERGHEVQLVVLRPTPWLSGAELPVPVHVIGLPGLLRPGSPRGLVRLRRKLATLPFDVLHTFYFDTMMATALLRPRLRGTPLVSSRRGFLDSERPHRTKHALLRLAARRWDHVVCNSKAVARYTKEREGVPEARITVIPNGVAFDDPDEAGARAAVERLRALGITEDDVLVVAVANLRPVKRLGTLVRATARLRERHPGLRVLVLGEGEERARLEALCEREGVADRVHLPGRCAHVRAVLAEADIGVLTSSSESLSNALIEYAAAGIPSVASDVGGNPEVVEEGRTGFLFDADTPEDLAERLDRLLCDKTLRTRMGQAATRVAGRYAWARCVDAHEALYRTLIGQAR